MLAQEYQEHQGAKDGNTLYVQYHFDLGQRRRVYQARAGVGPLSQRPAGGLTYGAQRQPGRCLEPSRRHPGRQRRQSGDVLASYSYLGLSRIVSEDYEQPEVRLQYFSGAATPRLDRFGRVVDQHWYDYGASASWDRFSYGYDRNSNGSTARIRWWRRRTSSTIMTP